MPRPTTRTDLLDAAASEYERLTRALADFPAERRDDVSWSAPTDDQSRNPRDVVAHLHAWHLLALGWCRTAEAGGVPAVPGPGRTWRETPALNAEIWQRYAAVPYADAVALLEASHREVVDVIAAHTQQQLFDKGVYAWTGSTTLGAYLVSSTSSHYAWGVKTLKAIRRFV